MDGNQPSKQTALSCRFCLKQFISYEEYAFHERMHMDQMAYTGSLRPHFDRTLPVYNSTGAHSGGPLESFSDLVQPFRNSVPGMEVRPHLDPRGIASPTGSEPRNSLQLDMRPLAQTNQVDNRNMNPNQIDMRNMVQSNSADVRNMVPSSPADVRNIVPSSPADMRNMVVSSPVDPRNFAAASPADPRNMVPSSPADLRNMVPSSPADPRNMVPSSPADPRNMVPSSPADPRNMVPSSPADPRNMVPSSPVDVRNLVPHSPAGDQRKLVASSPIDQRNMMASSPSDSRIVGTGHHDSRNMAPSSSTDVRNMIHHSQAEQRAMMASSPVDQRNLVPLSAADQRLQNTGQLEQRSVGSPADVRNLVPQSPVDSRPHMTANMGSPADLRNMVPQNPVESRPPMTASQTESRDAEHRSRIQSIVADIRTLESSRNSVEQRSFGPPSSSLYRRDEGQGFTAVPRSISTEQNSAMGSLPILSVDGRMLPVESQPMNPTNSQPLPYNSNSYLDSLTRDLYPHELTSKHPSSHTYTVPPLNAPVDSMGERQPIPPKLDSFSKHETYYGTKSDFPQPKEKVDSHLSGHYAGIKLLPSQSSYYQQSFPAHAPPRYDMNKLPTVPPNYYTQSGLPDPTAKVEHILHNPKQTLHYGQPAQPVPQHNHSQFQDSIPKPEQLSQHNQPQQRPQIASPIPVHGSVDQLRAYQTAPPTLPPYSQFHKGNHAQTQIHAPVPSRPVPNQHGYQPGESEKPLSTLTCHVCYSQFTNMNELSEHMKVHAQGMVAQKGIPKPLQQPVSSSTLNSDKSFKPTPSPVVTEHAPQSFIGNSNTIPSVGSGFKDKSADDTKCTVCGKFLKPMYLAEHMKSHSSNETCECKICKKVFKSKERCSKHEAHHHRDVRLVYCELCEEGFEFKGNYLYHVLNVHGKASENEPKVGTKKAIPLTGGSIDRSFESEESETDKHVNCQICDKETEKDKLVEHLKTHPIFECEKCDQVFIQKTAYVAHLMSVHRDELDNVSEKIGFKSVTNKEMIDKLMGSKEKVKAIDKKTNVQQVKSPADKLKEKEEKNKLKEQLKQEKKLEKKLLKEKEKEAKKVAKAQAKALEKAEKQLEKKKKKLERQSNKGIVYDTEDTNDTDKNRPNVSDKESSIEKVVEPLKFKCSKCTKTFKKDSELTTHSKTHVRDPSRFYCEVCDNSYHRLKEKGYYIYHMNYHRDADLMATNLPENLQCSLCLQPFTKSSLVTHIKKDHALYSCEICEWSYSAEKVLVTHMRRIHPKTHKQYVYVKKDFKDIVLEYKPESEVNEEQNDKLSEKDSEANDPSKVIPCKLCDRRFSKKQYYERHMRSHSSLEDTQLPCELCNFVFSCKGAYLYHIQHHPKVETDGLKIESGEMKMECDELKKESDDIKIEAGHLKVETGAVKIEEKLADKQDIGKPSEVKKIENEIPDAKKEIVDENKNGPNSELVTKEMVSPKESKKDTEYDNKGQMDKSNPDKSEQTSGHILEKEQHMVMVLNPITGEFEEQIVEEKEQERKEIEVKEKDSTEMVAEQRKSKEVAVEQKVENASKDNVNGLVYCRICSKCLKKGELAEHVRNHVLYSCDACEFSFTKKQKLVDHRQSLHLEDYIADEIRLYEIIEGTGKEDIEKEKSEPKDPGNEKESGKRKRGARLLNCSVCNTELKQDKFVEHIKGHIKPVLLCQFCEREFSKPNLLKMHEKSHERIAHLDTELPHPKLCPVCNTKIESRENYVTHLRTHKRKGPYNCKHCERVFTSDKNLENHTRVYHDSHVKVYWKEDGEGLKFDLRTGRISDVISDHLAEIREMNELLRQNGRPLIWHGSTPKKIKERNTSISKSKTTLKDKKNDTGSKMNTAESETNTESEEKLKTDTSDEEYVPDESENDKRGRRRSGRLAEKQESDNEDKDDDEEADKRPSRKRRHSTRSKPESEDLSSEEETEYKPKGTKSRKLAVTKAKFTVVKKGTKLLMKRKIGNRVLRSTLGNKDTKTKLKQVGLKRKIELKNKAVKRLRNRADLSDKMASQNKGENDGEDFPEKCPVCGTFQFSKQSYEEHCRIHTGENEFACPVCESTFTRNSNMIRHINFKHKGYVPKNLRNRSKAGVKSELAGKLRTRTRNLEKEDLKPISSSTPKRSPKLVVRLSPLDFDEKNKQVVPRELSPKAASMAIYNSLKGKDKMGRFQCDICNKVIYRKWNYAQHMNGHKKDNQKDNKPNGNKKDTKKKEKESKPFSCKDCSESFKKKRDLYIHTKVHQTDGAVEESIEDISTTDLKSSVNDSALANQSTSKVVISVNDSAELTDDTDTGVSKNESNNISKGRRSAVRGEDDSNKSVETNKIEQSKKRSLQGCDSDIRQVPEKRSKMDDCESKTNPTNKDDKTVSGTTDKPQASLESESEVEASSSQVNSASDVSVSVSQGVKSCDSSRRDSCELQNNNTDDAARSESSDMDDRKLKAQVPVTKMTAEKALLKWRAKVQDTLASQLELHATKKLEQLANPEIARVKEKLSTKTKSEVKNFECRICGDKFNAETTFRGHMEGHLYESPPYCSICDIYFMAIYPKKRLTEHNRKKHPIV